MENINYDKIRSSFLDFFESKKHTRLKSYSLIPEKDKSLLLINAGMAPLKDYFTGAKKMPNNRATSSQRCVRTADIDNVGKTHRHATFFEMLGNFSFGDYFKKEAIEWAWEYLVDVIGIDPEKLYITVYEEDEEAYDIWNKDVGVPAERIKKNGKDENFWELEEGPCGPCSEIHYDRGPKYDNTDDDRYMEIWNLVFTQFDKDKDGNYKPLPNPNIDTGMGLERLALVLEGADNIFELEAFRPLLESIENKSGKKYGASAKDDESFRVIMDHSKAMTFLVYDGVIPSNEQRGYILRRIIRRAYRHGKLLGMQGYFLADMIEKVMEIYKGEYPELLEDKERILKIIEKEEAQFQKTIDQGLEMLEDLLDELEEGDQLSGEDAFKLYDTYGFPLDLTKEIAKDRNISVDEDRFAEEMQKQKEQSRSSKSFNGGWDEERPEIEGYPKTGFIGYDIYETKAEVLGLMKDKEEVDQLVDGDRGLVILDKTPFYAESGGQVGDTGTIECDHARLRVLDTQKTAEEVYYHIVEVVEGSLEKGDIVDAKIDLKRRLAITKNHSATHILHKALKEVLGNHVNQAGSLVAPDRLRFDFTHFEAISPEDLKKIERIANEQIFLGHDVKITLTDLEGSQKMGAVGLFEDKYKDIVRVVEMGDFSIELCGGCHVDNTAEIQMLKILSESGIAAGVRRIEAITALDVYDHMIGLEQREADYASTLRVNKENIEHRINDLLEENKELEREIKSLQNLKTDLMIDDIEKQIEDKSNYKLLIKKFDDLEMDQIRDISDKLRDKYDDLIVIFASTANDKLLFQTSVSKPLTKKGANAGQIVKFVAQKTGGNGGGRPDFASAGGKDISKLDQAFDEVRRFIEEKVS